MKTFFLSKQIVIVFGLLIVASLTSCVQSSPISDLETQEHEEVPSVLLKLAIQDDRDTDTLNGLIEQFHTLHPSVHVDVIPLPADRYDEMLHMMMTSGEGPDLFQASNEWLTTYLYKNWLMDLSEIVDETIWSTYPEWAVDYTRQFNRFYAIPSELITLRLIYNKDLFLRSGLTADRPPETLKELRHYANVISQAGTGYRIYGFALPALDNEPLHQALEASSTYSGRYYYDFVQGQYDFSVYTSWFETMLDLKKEGGMFPGETALSMPTALTQFAEGNVGMMYVTSREFAQLTQLMNGIDHIGITMPPLLKQDDRGNGALMVTLESPMVIHTYTQHKSEAAALWNILHSHAYLGDRFSQGDAIPVDEAIADLSLSQHSPAGFRHFLPSPEESPYPQEPKFIMENRPQSGSVNTSDSLRAKVYKEILLGIEPAGPSLQRLTEQFNRSLDNAKYRSLINMENYLYPNFDPRYPMSETK